MNSFGDVCKAIFALFLLFAVLIGSFAIFMAYPIFCSIVLCVPIGAAAIYGGFLVSKDVWRFLNEDDND